MDPDQGTHTLRGTGVSPGTGAGPVLRLAGAVSEPAPDEIPQGAPAAERARAVEALETVASALEDRGHRAGGDAEEVLSAQALMARDPGLAAEVDRLVEAGTSASRAVYEAFGVYREMLAGAGDYVAGRVADLDDIRDRVVSCLQGLPEPGVPVVREPYVLVARDLAPADTALLDPVIVRAIVTEEGGPTSHTAILARSMGVPAVVACADASRLDDGLSVLVDGGSGEVRVDPPDADVRAAMEASAVRARAVAGATGPGATSDGHGVPLLANIGAPGDVDAAIAAGAEGVGLYRTEFLFLDRSEQPSEHEQADAYASVLAAFPEGRVVVRTLDAGADKPLGFLPAPGAEPNPALGERGLRMLRRHPEMLSGQLRALGQAVAEAESVARLEAAGGSMAASGTARGSMARLEVMAPMVADAEDARWFVAACRQAGLVPPVDGGSGSPGGSNAESQADGGSGSPGSEDSGWPVDSGSGSPGRSGFASPRSEASSPRENASPGTREPSSPAHIGVMVEIPSAALRAPDLVAEVDFLSIGTNDLAQYAFAADRQVGALGRLQDPWQPAVLDLVALAASAAEAASAGCGVCGEAAADPVLACVLVGLGVTSLSMGAPAIPFVRAALAAHSLAECRSAAAAARNARTPDEARTAARDQLPRLTDLGL